MPEPFYIWGQDLNQPRNSINIGKSMPDVFMQALELSTLDEEQSEGDKTEAGRESAEKGNSKFAVHTAVRKIFAYQKAHPGKFFVFRLLCRLAVRHFC